jgi:hypothetical protein
MPMITQPIPGSSVASANGIIVFPAREVLSAWNALVQDVSLPPTSPGQWCYFDHKRWGDPTQAAPLESREPFVSMLGTLYCASQLYDFGELYSLVNNGCAEDIAVNCGQLDPDIARVVNSKKRFRHSLSEHVDYWVHLGSLAKAGIYGQFYRSKPNLQPEDKGPDGVSCARIDTQDTSPVIQVHSVKSSIGKPSSLLASAAFRRRGNATASKKLLEEFWRIAHENESTVRLDSMLEQITLVLQWQPSRQLRSALMGKCNFHGSVVADDRFADEADFEGYQHVVPDVMRRHAVYLGSSSWIAFAEACRSWLRNCLIQAGVKL